MGGCVSCPSDTRLAAREMMKPPYLCLQPGPSPVAGEFTPRGCFVVLVVFVFPASAFDGCLVPCSDV